MAKAALLLLAVAMSQVSGHVRDPPAEVFGQPQHHKHNLRGPHHPRGAAQRASHEHYTPHRSAHGSVTKITQDAQLLHDEEHIREDLGNVNVDTKKMTTEELEFHYFKLHDFDNNTKLDGLEILQAIQHIVHEGHEVEENGGEASRPPRDDFAYYIELIDKVLEEDDLDNDGYLSYIEYVLGRQKDDHQLKHSTQKTSMRR